MTTKREVESAARRRWGKTGFVQENRRALSACKRQQLSDELKEIARREKELGEQIEGMEYDWHQLLAAAEFWRDVDGSEPSTSQLKAAVARCRQYVDLCDERQSLKEERQSKRGGSFRFRWEAGEIYTINGLGQGASVQEQADTLDELLAKINRFVSAEITATTSMA